MKRIRILKYLFIPVFLFAALILPIHGQQWFLDLETGGVFGGYNDVRVPGDSGTAFSLVDDFPTPGSFFFRFRLGYDFNPRHTVSVLYAPLSLDGSGKVDFRLSFYGVDFPANTALDSTYKFNSYRLTYRYTLLKKENVRLGLGLTAKIRDAAIRLEGGGLRSERTNIGFVPLVNFLLEWRLRPSLGLLLEGDALAAPQGRAEDVLLALVYQKSERLAFKAGYRILEGGADNDEVYSFALFHYLVVGVTYHFQL